MTNTTETIETVRHIAELIPKIDEKVDRATRAVLAVEELLKEIVVGITATVIVCGDDRGATLSYRRISKQKGWGFVVKKGLCNWPFAEAPRMLRLSTVLVLPELIEAIETTAKELANQATNIELYLQEIESAVSALRANEGTL